MLKMDENNFGKLLSYARDYKKSEIQYRASVRQQEKIINDIQEDRLENNIKDYVKIIFGWLDEYSKSQSLNESKQSQREHLFLMKTSDVSCSTNVPDTLDFEFEGHGEYSQTAEEIIEAVSSGYSVYHDDLAIGLMIEKIALMILRGRVQIQTVLDLESNNHISIMANSGFENPEVINSDKLYKNFKKNSEIFVDWARAMRFDHRGSLFNSDDEIRIPTEKAVSFTLCSSEGLHLYIESRIYDEQSTDSTNFNCSGMTVENMLKEFESNGKSTIIASIIEDVAMDILTGKIYENILLGMKDTPENKL
jgi:hypothetical protein